MRRHLTRGRKTSSIKICKKHPKIYEGESVEMQLERVIIGNEVIEFGGKETVYSERKDGVIPQMNIRTDKFEIAQEAMDARERQREARQIDFMNKEKLAKNPENSQSTEGTEKQQ